MLIVDGFAGGGGASAGIEMALGVSPTIAINHDPEAIEMHAINHPSTRHYCESIYTVRPEVATGGKSPDLAWFSPDCCHFSSARGAKPMSSKRRGLAWSVTSWAARVRPAVIVVENVAEFLTWGPLGADGRPRESGVGRYFRAWVLKLEKLGYHVAWHQLRACDYGAPTTRLRLYVIARLGSDPRWPTPTHGPIALPYRSAAECIDWQAPTRSIFGLARPPTVPTLRRVRRAVCKYLVDGASPVIVGDRAAAIVQLGYGERAGQLPRVFDIRRPLSTVVAGSVKHGLVTAVLGDAPSLQVNSFLGCEAIVAGRAVIDLELRKLTPRELANAQGLPAHYVIDGGNGPKLSVTAQVRMIGNSVASPVAAAIVRANVGGV